MQGEKEKENRKIKKSFKMSQTKKTKPEVDLKRREKINKLDIYRKKMKKKSNRKRESVCVCDASDELAETYHRLELSFLAYQNVVGSVSVFPANGVTARKPRKIMAGFSC